jgi:hypothetical protein
VPRAGWVKPETNQRLSDHISIGVLTRVFPPELVDAVVEATGRSGQRQRLMPARVTTYYVLAMALFSQASYEEVMRFLVDGLAWQSGWRQEWRVPTKAAIFQARKRLGPLPLQALFEGTARPLGTAERAGVWLRGWRVMSLDGTCLDVADTPANEAAFSRPGSSRGEGRSAFPQVRLVGLCEVGTHAIVDAALGPYRSGERELARRLLRSLAPGMLCIADRGFYSGSLWREAAATGAELLWRLRTDVTVTHERDLADGSYLAVVGGREARRAGHDHLVRVIDYRLDDGDGQEYRLLSTIADPDAATASELARAYAQRWELESAFDELKTHQRGSHVVLRSKQPDGVLQEAYGYLCTHYAIRTLMHEAALAAELDPDRLSFTRTLRVARRTTGSHPGFSP